MANGVAVWGNGIKHESRVGEMGTHGAGDEALEDAGIMPVLTLFYKIAPDAVWHVVNLPETAKWQCRFRRKNKLLLRNEESHR